MDKKNVEIEKTMLIDGRLAERHVSYDENGNKIIEIFTEEKKPLHLEKRIIQKHKEILAEEIIENVKDGVVIEREVLSVEPPAQMKVVEHVGVVDHAKTVDGDYMTKKEVSEAIIAGIASLLENMPQNNLKAQEVEKQVFMPMAEKKLADRVEAKSETNNSMLNVVLGVLIVAQLGAVYWAFFM